VEWLSSLPKHFQLYSTFGWELPVFCHLPLLRNADRSKISKRKNPVSLNHYRRAGFLPEALVNYLALMGFAMPEGREEFGFEDLVAEIALEKISLGGPVFDVEKLTWLNGRYLRRLTPEALLARLQQHALSHEHLLQVLPLVQERIDTLEGFFEYATFFFVGEVAYDHAALAAMVPKGHAPVEVGKLLARFVEERVDPLLEWTAASVEAALREFGESAGLEARDLMMTVRVALSGRTASPPLFETAAVLGKEICRRRLRRAAAELRKAK
jgi:glutamyl-tRNA synthetase